MLRAGRMEDFVTEEEEPWYDQRDLEQGEVACVCRVSGLCMRVGVRSDGLTMPHPRSMYPGIKGSVQCGGCWRMMHSL